MSYVGANFKMSSERNLIDFFRNSSLTILCKESFRRQTIMQREYLQGRLNQNNELIGCKQWLVTLNSELFGLVKCYELKLIPGKKKNQQHWTLFICFTENLKWFTFVETFVSFCLIHETDILYLKWLTSVETLQSFFPHEMDIPFGFKARE